MTAYYQSFLQKYDNHFALNSFLLTSWYLIILQYATICRAFSRNIILQKYNKHKCTKKKNDILLTYQNFCQKLNNIITFTLIITTEKTNSH